MKDGANPDLEASAATSRGAAGGKSERADDERAVC